MIRKEKHIINYLLFMYTAMLEIYIKYALKMILLNILYKYLYNIFQVGNIPK